MSRYLLANWKSNKTLSEAESWLETFCQIHQSNPQLQIIIAPPIHYLVPMWHKVHEVHANLALAVQDISPFPLGSYTGEVAAEMVKDFAEYAILGHSERRRYFHETNQEIANKVSEAVAVGIKPIVCVDLPHARQQIAAINEEDLKDVIIGYGPVEAAGINIPQSFDKVSDGIGKIQILAPDCPILYGGSINKANAGDYMNFDGISGLMVGNTSLAPGEFADIGRNIVLAQK